VKSSCIFIKESMRTELYTSNETYSFYHIRNCIGSLILYCDIEI
jgi:hypothetical protein